MKLQTRLFVFGIVAVLALAVLWIFSRNPKDVYSIAEVRYANITSTMTISGKIAPEKEVEVKPHISAYVSKILVRSGDNVKKGQRLMTLEAIPDVFALEEAEAAVELKKIALKQAQTDFERAKKLFAGRSISAKEYETAVNALDVAKTQLNLAQNQRSIIASGGSKRSSQHNESVILSPIDGVVSNIPVSEGESVAPIGIASLGTTLCKVADNGPFVFKGYVDETDISVISKGMKVSLVLGAYPDIEIPAEIVSVSSYGKLTEGFTQFEIKASMNTLPKGVELHSGFSANAKIETRSLQHVLSVPEECIRFDENRIPYVLRLTSNPNRVRNQRWEKVPVEFGISDGRIIQVISGLEENDFVQTLTKNPR